MTTMTNHEFHNYFLEQFIARLRAYDWHGLLSLQFASLEKLAKTTDCSERGTLESCVFMTRVALKDSV